VLAETLAGSRPAQQIVPWTTEQARDHIQRLGAQLASGQQPRVRRVVTSRPCSDVLEMTAVVGFGARVRALAVRFERTGPAPADGGSPWGAGGPAPAAGRPTWGGGSGLATGWLCTAIEAA